MSEKISKKNIIINAIYYAELGLLVLAVIATICSYIPFCSLQKLKVTYYLNTDKIEQLSMEECEKIFGEPIWVNNLGTYEFEGGSICTGGFFLMYSEYILYVEPTEDGTGVESAYTRCVYEYIF